MSSAATTAQLFVKPLQYIEETNEGTVPTSGSTTAIGAATSLDVTMNGNYIQIGQVGPEDLHSLAQGVTGWESSIEYQPTDSTFLKYATNAANYASPSGTISKSLSVIYSIYLNGVENYIVLRGTRAKSITYSKKVGKADLVNMTFIHTTVNAPTSTPPTGLTLVTGFPSGVVFDWLSGGANPMSWNSVAQNCKDFTVTIERNTSADYTLGNTAAFGTQPHGRRIKGSFAVIWTGTALENDYRNGTSRTLVLVLKASASTMTISNAKITSYKRSKASDSTEAIVEDCEFEATSLVVS